MLIVISSGTTRKVSEKKKASLATSTQNLTGGVSQESWVRK